MKYVLRRFTRVVLLLIGVSVLCFAFTALAPGNYLDEMRLNPQISPDTIASLRAQYAMDRPLPVRYARWVESVTRGEWGYSFAYNMPVAPLIWVRARNTLLLALVAMFGAWLIAVPLGVCAGVRPGGWADHLTHALTAIFLSLPEIVIAVVVLAAVVRVSWLPAGGMTSLGFDELSRAAQLRDLLRHVLVPATILIVAGLPVILRHVRAAVAEIVHAPYIAAARAHGIPPLRLVFRHVLPAAANPAISLFGFSLAGLLSGSLLVEVITGWPGLGPLILEATLARDIYVVICGVMLSTLALLAGSLAADVLLLLADPRISVEAPHV
ncbi:MAG TPA: ABC transporter permease [Terriglobales bacterium]|nr:ABC transporter permease [Terriglobales bacterium]